MSNRLPPARGPQVYLLDRRHLLIDWRTPAAADLGGPPAAGGGGGGGAGGPGAPPGQFLMLFDLQTTRVVAFKSSEWSEPSGLGLIRQALRAHCQFRQPLPNAHVSRLLPMPAAALA